MSAAAVAPRAPGAARRLSSQSPKPPGARDNKEPPPQREDADKAKDARRRLPPSLSAPSPSPTRGAAASMLLRRAAGAGGRGSSSSYVHPSSSLSVSCASEASTESFCSRASTGRIGRRPAGPPVGAPRRRAAGSAGRPSARPAATSRKVASSSSVVVPGVAAAATVQVVVPPVVGLLNAEPTAASAGPPRCPWVTPNTDPCYAAFHDQEWGVPVHDDKKLFEMLTLSGALAEMAWPAILSKRDTFREVFMNFDPQLVAKLNEKKFLAPCSPASSLLSQHRLRIIIENARELLKVIDEFGSFDSYCWSFMSNKPMVGGYRHTREVPLRTAKADAISQDLMRRGFLGVGPTVVYAFMQAVGMANDHLVTCYRFEECCDIIESSAAPSEGYDGDNGKKPPTAAVAASDQEVSMLCGLVQCVTLEPSRAATAAVISIS